MFFHQGISHACIIFKIDLSWQYLFSFPASDGGHAFDKVLFHGQETTLIMFEILLFCMVDLIFTNFVLAGIVTYVAMMVGSEIW